MSAPREYVPLPFVVACSVCPVGPVIVTLALGRTAPVESVTLPTILPVEIEVWANATEHISSADRVINTSSINRAPGREELRFNIVNLPFGNVLIGVFSPKVVWNLVFQNSCRSPSSGKTKPCRKEKAQTPQAATSKLLYRAFLAE